jgi:glycosyltransferase involved in cell wall biosynthesis
LAHDKGVDDLIAVADMVHSALRDVEFVLAGDWDDADPPSMATKQSLLSRPYLKRVGHVDDASTYLRSISVLCFPSHREGLPNAVIEAAACGVPTVGWDVTGTRDAIVNARTGYLISKGDHRAMASAIVNLLTDASLLLAMGNAAHAFSLERFSEETVVTAFLEYLNSTVAE